MDAQHLIHMANRIAEFFDAMDDRQAAAAGVGEHLRRFWAPAMRQALLAHIHTHGTQGLHPLAIQALGTLGTLGTS